MGRAYYESLPQPDSDVLKDLERELKELCEREETIIELMKRRLVKITDGQQEIEQDIRPRVAIIARSCGRLDGYPFCGCRACRKRRPRFARSQKALCPRHTGTGGIYSTRSETCA
jgi:hypothetical protein